MAKIIGLDGEIYTLHLKEHEINDNDRSAGHLKCRGVLKKLYPYDLIFEEITTPDSDLTFDFLIPLRKLAVEIQGRQHYEFVKYFHKNLGEFNKQKNRDSQKKQWCDLNNYTLVQLDDKDSEEDWKTQILNSFK